MIAPLGAVEIALNMGYLLSQVFWWSWGANKKRAEAARFTAAFTVILVAAVLLAIQGFDPLRITLISAALTVVIMPLVVLPFIVLMNDPKYVKDHTSGPVGNVLLAGLTIVAGVLAIVVIPLELLGG